MHSTSKSVSHHHKSKTHKRKGSILHRIKSAPRKIKRWNKQGRAANKKFQSDLKKIGKNGSMDAVNKAAKKYDERRKKINRKFRHSL